nr:phosphatase PAP2 family protein [Candidatus Nitrosopumilus sp. SW]
MLTILFLILTGLVYSGITESFDQSIVSFFSQNVGNPTLDIIMQYVTESGDVFNMLVFGIVMLIIPKTRRIGITLMILIVLSTLLTGYIKCGIDRDRPDFDYEGVEFPVEISRDTFALFCEGGFDASYPSGHAARAMIFGIILGYALSERFPRGAYLLFLYPVMISLSRIYVLQHYPMDVIGGTVIGIMLAGVMANRTKLYKIFDKSKT